MISFLGEGQIVAHQCETRPFDVGRVVAYNLCRIWELRNTVIALHRNPPWPKKLSKGLTGVLRKSGSSLSSIKD